MQSIVLRSETRTKAGLDIPIVLYAGEDGYIVAVAPSLPGCISQGSTEDEALANIQEAVELCLESMEEEGWSLPATYSLGHIELSETDA
jgi:predicted RNase H-like HicB family nuclease